MNSVGWTCGVCVAMDSMWIRFEGRRCNRFEYSWAVISSLNKSGWSVIGGNNVKWEINEWCIG